MVIRAGVVGHPISHSLSPRIYNTWLNDYGVAGEYTTVDTAPDDFEMTIRQLMDDGWSGVNVTLPHKAAAFAMSDIKNPMAEAIGAANLLRFTNGLIVADNTDVPGFQHCLGEGATASDDRHAVVLGAGGASGAIIQALSHCTQITVVNRTLSKAQAVADHFGDHVRAASWDALSDLLPSADYLVNATSLGMTGQPPLSVDVVRLPASAEVFDIVYAPLETALLRAARERGHRAVGGLSMLVYQAVPSFHAYTGIQVSDPDAILRTLEAELS